MTVGKFYLDSVVIRFSIYKEMGEKTFDQLQDKEFHYSPNEESNSIAVIVQHMSGNMISRWTNFLTEDGEKQWRERDREFEVQNASREQILNIWRKGWNCLFGALGELSEEDLTRNIRIRNEAMPVLDAINRQLAHYAYHVGQIVYIAKMLRGQEWRTLSIPKKKPIRQ